MHGWVAPCVLLSVSLMLVVSFFLFSVVMCVLGGVHSFVACSCVSRAPLHSAYNILLRVAWTHK